MSQLFSRTDGLTHTLGRAKPQLFLNYTKENTNTYKISLGCFTSREAKSTKVESKVFRLLEMKKSKKFLRYCLFDEIIDQVAKRL